MKLPEIVCRDGCIVRGGVQGGTSGTIYCLWYMGADYDDDIAQEMSYQQYFQLEIVKKSATTTYQ